MTELRAAAHRWSVIFFVCLSLTASALRHVRRARHRRRFWRKVDSWTW